MSEAGGEQGNGAAVDQAFDAAYNDFLADQEREYGPDDLDEQALFEGLDGEDAQGEAESPEERPAPAREGTDRVLDRLNRTDPGAARVLQEMQRAMSRSMNETQMLREEFAALRQELYAPQQAPEAPSLPEGVTDENVKIFKQVADYLGYVPREELQAKETAEASTSYVQSSLQQGVEAYGDAFGTVDEQGKVHLAPEVSRRLQKRMQLLQDPQRGLTPLDLFVLEYGVPQGKNGGARAARPTASVRPTVARRSAGSGSTPRIYDPSRADSAEDVIDRAWAVARRNLTGR